MMQQQLHSRSGSDKMSNAGSASIERDPLISGNAWRHQSMDRKYTFEYEIGQWTYGTVQVLKDRHTTELRVCKTVPKASIRNPQEVVARLTRMIALKHEHINGIIDVVEDNQRIFLVFEKLMGGDLAEWTSRVIDDGNWLEEQTVVDYVRQALIALHHGHSQHIWHKDLRPSSLLLTSKLPNAKVKITDFGLADVFDPMNTMMQNSGNPYAAPEVLDPLKLKGQEGNASPAAADMWSMGAIAHHLLVGVHPPRWDGDIEEPGSTWSMLARAGSKVIDKDADLDPLMFERSSLSRDFVRKLTALQASDRPTAAEALQHPWIEACFTLNPAMWPTNRATEELKHRLVCYTLAILMLPTKMQYRDLFQLRSSFASADLDHDGYLSIAAAKRLLRDKGSTTAENAGAALEAVDVKETGVVDLATAGAAWVLAHSFSATEAEEPQYKLINMAERVRIGFFQLFGGGQGSVVSADSIRNQHTQVVVTDVEQYFGVCFDDIFSTVPDEECFDEEGLVEAIILGQGRGTPLANDDGGSDDEDDDGSWVDTLGFDRIHDLFRGIFHSCGLTESIGCGIPAKKHTRMAGRY
mmetsp:Transcript_55140/g.120678  ORF Transcript_55140/g.120678 Transcript_55140/m.120678 type:complete len:581 (-) Transcript_55140:279-2021(-)|eukprot:CAMPEP_0206463514 /NCGR_PEP_ID=MMETSP0324_2-20121206/26653_1 /ASSEMBLY_ACC=CAM_ASM_000836 /TAXON_ID=2866 /ORGANISM="Crypthecodinium cohnii, Strain Seligo" /LENGTH=580 /DNA_ID=CAMNT_0053935943 /DNA_START=140 /DNA_END=1882 /DNA_ORIENTATION=-